MHDPWRRREPVRDESWEDVYRAAGVGTAYQDDTDEAVEIVAEQPERAVSGTATPGNDHYDPSLDDLRLRQSPRDAVRDPWRDDISAFTW